MSRLLAASLVTAAAGLAPLAAEPALRPIELVEGAARHLGTVVRVDIV